MVPYVYNGQTFQIRVINGTVNAVMQDNKILVFVRNGTPTPFPNVDAHLAADAENALKAYSAGTPSGVQATPVASSGVSAKATLTVDNVVTMLDAGISEDIITAKIHQSGQSFDLTTDDMMRLKKAKASDALVKTMMQPGSSSAASAPQTGSTTSPTTPPSPSAAPEPVKKSGGFFSSLKGRVQGKDVIDEVGLANILPPYDPAKLVSEQFPHVAVTVVKAPMGWTEPYADDKSINGGFIGRPCFKLEAVIWSDPTHSKKVAPFDWCAQDDRLISKLEPTYIYSLRVSPRDEQSGYLTGINRTNGPAPPAKMLPNDAATMEKEARTNPSHTSKDLNLDQTSQFAIMFATIRRKMGESLNADGDARVWVVSIN